METGWRVAIQMTPVGEAQASARAFAWAKKVELPALTGVISGTNDEPTSDGLIVEKRRLSTGASSYFLVSRGRFATQENPAPGECSMDSKRRRLIGKQSTIAACVWTSESHSPILCIRF